MKRHFLFIFFIFFLLNCSNKEKNVPKDLVSDAKMVGILIDIHFLDAKIEEMNLSKDTALYIYNTLEEDIWKTHSTNEKQFKESLKYFIKNSVEYEAIYKKVIDSIGIMESREQRL